MLALGEYENGLCECGFHESLTGDPSNHFTFEQRICPVCRGAARWSRIQDAEDDKERKALGDKMPPGRTLQTDGRRTFIRKMSQLEVQELRERQSQSRSG